MVHDALTTFEIFHLIASEKSPLPCELTYSQVVEIRNRPLGGATVLFTILFFLDICCYVYEERNEWIGVPQDILAKADCSLGRPTLSLPSFSPPKESSL